MRVLCGHALSSWKMKPETTAAILKGITTGFNELVTKMHNQTRWATTAIDLISVIFFAHPNLFRLICGSDMDMIHNNFCISLTQNLEKIYIFRFIILFVFKDNEINITIPNFCPPVYYAGVLPNPFNMNET